MPKATWNDAALVEADSTRVQVVEGDVYFPPDAVNRALLKDSQMHTVCPWKGTASYYGVVVDGKTRSAHFNSRKWRRAPFGMG
jgi:uncharacterized protein (DUF427 family)